MASQYLAGLLCILHIFLLPSHNTTMIKRQSVTGEFVNVEEKEVLKNDGKLEN